jgi:hypothetical protein
MPVSQAKRPFDNIRYRKRDYKPTRKPKQENSQERPNRFVCRHSGKVDLIDLWLQLI